MGSSMTEPLPQQQRVWVWVWMWMWVLSKQGTARDMGLSAFVYAEVPNQRSADITMALCTQPSTAVHYRQEMDDKL